MNPAYRAPLIVSGGVITGLTLAATAALLTRSKRAPPTPVPESVKPMSDDREAAKAEIWRLGSILADELGWPGLPQFMLAQAWAESRYKRTARNPEASWNAARGVFQIRPTGAMLGTGDPIEQNPDLLYDIATSVALDAWYLHRLHKWAQTDQIDWLAERRGTAYPRLVKDFAETHQRSIDVRRRLEKALRAVGLPKWFMHNRAFPHTWPGIDRVFELLDVDLTAPKITAAEVRVWEPPPSSEGGISFEALGEEEAA
jgi:hypothetical protein